MKAGGVQRGVWILAAASIGLVSPFVAKANGLGLAWVLTQTGCKEGDPQDTADTGFFEKMLCSEPDPSSYQRQISDEDIRKIASLCDPGLRIDSGRKLIKSELPANCDAAVDAVIAPLLDLDSFMVSAEGVEARKQLKEAIVFLLFTDLRTPRNDEMWGSANAACHDYATGVLDSAMTPSGSPAGRPAIYPTRLTSQPIVLNSGAPVNATLFRYILERLTELSFDSTMMDSAATESYGDIILGNSYGRPITEVAASGSLVHEARHIDSSLDEGAPHVACETTDSMKGMRFCDDDLFGANGLEVQYYDALIRGMARRTVTSPFDGTVVPALSGDQIMYAIYETCLTVNYKINEPDAGVAEVFAPYRGRNPEDPNCTTHLWQKPENAARLACAIYGISLDFGAGRPNYPCGG